jgi:poly-beta-hydroxybutyrate-responsive repressor
MQPPIWGFLQPCLLLLLSKGSHHGYSLMEELSQKNLLGVEVDVGNLYRTLRRMEAEGLVVSEWDATGSGPNKRVYRITQSGQDLLQNWAATLEQRTRTINRFLEEFHHIFGPASARPQPRFISDEDEENPI